MNKITELLRGNKTDNPKLRAKKISDGTYSIYLDYYYGATQYEDDNGETKTRTHRQKEFLNRYLKENPKTAKEKQVQRETIELVKKIRFEKEQEFLEDKTGYRLQPKDKNFIVYMDNFVKNRKNADYKIFQMVQRAFNNFLKESYPHYVDILNTTRLNSVMVEEFVDYIIDTYQGYTPLTIYKRFKQIINKGVSEKFFKVSPCIDVKSPSSAGIRPKEVLTLEEEKKLFVTHYDRENPEIRRGFAVTCCTGIRFCDLAALTYENVDYSSRLLTFRQKKEHNISSTETVVIPLNDYLLNLIGEKPMNKDRTDFIFNLPSHTMCLKALRRWTAAAGIEKHITWHCGRHSFATNLLYNDADIKTVSTLLGHSTLKYTQRYLHYTDSKNVAAINSITNGFSSAV